MVGYSVIRSCCRNYRWVRTGTDWWRRLSTRCTTLSLHCRAKPHHAIGTSLVAIGLISLTSLVRYVRSGHISFRIGLVMASTSLIGVYLGSYMNKFVNGPMLLVMFSALLIVIAVRMLMRRDGSTHTSNTGVRPSQHYPTKTRIDYKRILLLGFMAGTASGFLVPAAGS